MDILDKCAELPCFASSSFEGAVLDLHCSGTTIYGLSPAWPRSRLSLVLSEQLEDLFCTSLAVLSASVLVLK